MGVHIDVMGGVRTGCRCAVLLGKQRALPGSELALTRRALPIGRVEWNDEAGAYRS